MIIGLFASPAEELRLPARRGQRSWEMAVELRHGGAEPDAIRAALERCTRDEAPPARVEGTGPAFGR